MEYTNLVIKALRKYHGYQQASFCRFLNIQQGTLSKIESGLLSINATVWIDICMKFKINPEAIVSGRIELMENLPLKLRQEPLGNIKINKKYTHNMGSTVRTVYPLINFLRHRIGLKKTNELVKGLGVDPEYFVIQNLPINILFIQDLFLEIVSLGLIDQDSVKSLLEYADSGEVHKFALSNILVNDHPEQNFKRFTKIVKDFYEINTNYHFVGDKENYVEAVDNKHIESLRLTAEFQTFRSTFNQEHFNLLAPMLNSNYFFKSNRTKNGWELALV